MIRNVLICTTQVPFTSGGAEFHVDGLQRALVAGGFNAEIVRLPFKWYPPEEIMRGTLAWRLLDVSEANGKPIDLVIAMKFPCYVVAHPNKVLWIMHQHRAAYNLWGTQFDDLSAYAEGPSIRNWIRECDRRFIPQAKRVFANSNTVADRLQRYNEINSEPLYHPPPLFEEIRPGEQGNYFFYPSRLEPQKRQDLLIEALRFTRTPVQIVLAGGSNDVQRYQAQIKASGAGERIKLLGYVSTEQMLELYANALGVCYLPFDEDYGYVALEGMLAAKPLIVPRDAGGPTEFIEHGAEGLIVDPDPEAIAGALDTLYADRERALAMGTRARDRVLSMNLSWQKVAEKLIAAGAQ